MKSFILVALCLVSALSFQMTDVAEVEWPFNNCGDGDFTVTKFTWSDTPVKGGTVTFSVIGTAKNSVSFFQEYITAYVNGLPISITLDDWSASYSKGSDITYNRRYQLPSDSGSYGIKVVFNNARDEKLACVSVSYKL